MPDSLYLITMLLVIGVITVLAVPSLFRRKCGKCGARNDLEAKVCKQCGQVFPSEE